MLAILEALLKWEDKLLGYCIHVVTDHKALEFDQMQLRLTARQMRWIDYLARFDFDIRYIKGTLNRGLYCPPGILYGLLGLFRLSADSTWTGHGIFLAGHPANFKFLVLVQSVDSPSKVLVNSEDSSDARTFHGMFPHTVCGLESDDPCGQVHVHSADTLT